MWRVKYNAWVVFNVSMKYVLCWCCTTYDITFNREGLLPKMNVIKIISGFKFIISMKPDLIFVDKIFEIRHSKHLVEQGLNIWVSDWACHITHPDCVRARNIKASRGKHYIYTISTLVIVKHLSIFGSSLHSWRTPGRSCAQWLRRWKQTPYFIIIIVNVRAAQ